MLSNLGKESTALIHCILYLIHEDKKQSKTQTLCSRTYFLVKHMIAMQGDRCTDTGKFQVLWGNEKGSSPGRASRGSFIMILGEQH